MRYSYLAFVFVLLESVAICGQEVVVSDVTSYSDTVCKEDGWVTLSVDSVNRRYNNAVWFVEGNEEDTIAVGLSVRVRVDSSVTYVARIITDTVRENMLSNGGFEGGFTGFTTDCQTASDDMGQSILDPENLYDTYFSGRFGQFYAISSDAHRLSESFFSIESYSGSYFGYFDSKYAYFNPLEPPFVAWMAETSDNPSLRLVKGERYTFSFFVNVPSVGSVMPKLRIGIFYWRGSDADGDDQWGATYFDGDDIDLSVADGNSWVGYRFSWLSSVDNDTVRIRIVNSQANTSSSHTETRFCLDDIRFDHISKFIENREEHKVIVRRCEAGSDTVARECIDGFVYGKWDNVLFVDKGEAGLKLLGGHPVAYQWYRDGVAIEGMIEQVYYNPGGMSGVYSVRVMLDNDSVVESCPHRFDEFPRSAKFNPGIDNRESYKIKSLYRCGEMELLRLEGEDGETYIKKQIKR